MPQEEPFVVQYARPIRRRDHTWGIVANVLPLLALILFLAPFGAREPFPSMAVTIWMLGMAFGFLGLWERGSARKLAVIGLFVNVLLPFVPAVLALISFLGLH
jgi:hypothetical protein